MDIKKIRKQAQDENTSSEILAQLATNKDGLTRQYIASNPNTPVETLKQLIREFPEQILQNTLSDLLLLEKSDNTLIQSAIARISTTPIKTLVKLSECNNFDVRAAVAENLNTPLTILDKLAVRVDNRPFPARVFTAIAKNPNTTADILDKLIQAGGDVCVPVYNAVLENPKVSITTLERLANKQNISIEHSVFKHPKITDKFLEQLRLSPYTKVREAVAEHSKTAYSVVCVLAKDSSENVRIKIAQRHDLAQDIIENLVRDSSKRVRTKIANYKYLSPKLISNLAQDSSEEVRHAVANHQNAVQETINNLAQDSSEKVRHAVACRQDIAEDTVNILAQDSSEEIRRAVARRHNISDVTADRLAQDSSKEVRCQIARNGFISEKIANRLAHDNSEYVRRLLVNHYYSHRPPKYTHQKAQINQNVSARTLEILLEKSDENNYHQLPQDIDLKFSHLKFSKDYLISAIYNLETRRDIARHPQATFNILDRLKSDRYDCTRQAVASNRNNCYPEIIIDLANDSAVIVRSAIARNIKSHDFTLVALPSEKNNLYTFEGILDKLIDDDETVRCAVAQNPHALENILASLANDSSKIVRQAIASNFNTSTKILEQLKNDDIILVRWGVAKNPNTSLNALEELSDSIHENIAREANLNLAEKQQAIQKASNENTLPEALVKLAKSRSKVVRQYVASNANTPIKTLEILSKEFPEEITVNPVFVLLMMENPTSPFIQLSLARSRTTSEKTLIKLYHRHRQYKTRESCKILIAIANNNRASDKLRKQLKFEIRSFLGGGIEYNYTL